MYSFCLKGKKGKIEITIKKVYCFPDQTSFKGGYDCLISINIDLGVYKVSSQIHSATGEIFSFYENLKTCHESLNGSAEFITHERNLEFTVTYVSGKVNIKGQHQNDLNQDTFLHFEIESDQSYFHESLEELESIFKYYGGMSGAIS